MGSSIPERTFSSDTLSREWTLITPSRFITSTISVNFTGLPNDVNTFQPAAVDPNASVASASVSTEDKRLVARRLSAIRPLTVINRQGATNIPLLGLIIENEPSLDQDYVRVDNVRIKLVKNANQEDYQEPWRYISRIRIMNYSYYRANFTKPDSIPQMFTEYTLQSSVGAEIGISFDMDTLRLNSSQSDTLVFLVDLSNEAPNSSFIFKVTNIFAFLGELDNPVSG